MDASRRSPPADTGAAASLHAALTLALAGARAGGERVALALSGGRDSVALLDVAASVCASMGVELVALHVHHGLSAHADEWAAFSARAAGARGIAFAQQRVHLQAAPPQGIEAAARDARYAALAALAKAAGARMVLLAHHQDDQAETLLLQLLRGAGPRGLAAMAPMHEANGIIWLRPWLDVPRALIEAYGRDRALHHVEDDSNVDTRYRRNALRTQVVPALRSLAPGYPGTLARAAAHQAEAATLLHDLARIDAAPHYDGHSLARAALCELAPERARNVLRWFLHERGLAPPSASRLAALFHQLRNARAGAAVRLCHAGREIGLYRERIHAHLPAPAGYEAHWAGGAPLRLPHGELHAVPAAGGPVNLDRLFAAGVVVRSRSGGERLRPRPDSPTRALKEVLREAALAPWDRAAVPLVFAGGTLAVVPGVAVDAAFHAAAGARSGALLWHPHPGAVPPHVAHGGPLG